MSPDGVIKTVAVFCGARDGARPVFREAAKKLGAAIARRKLALVYGGGSLGMMGTVADAVLAAGGEVTGVIPFGLSRKEFAHEKITKLHTVDTMHERKQMMADLADAFIAMPGGFGTLDELFEIVTWGQIGLHAKPVGLLDTDGYWEGIRLQIARSVKDGFVAEGQDALIVIEAEPERLLERVLAHAPPPPVITWQNRSGCQ